MKNKFIYIECPNCKNVFKEEEMLSEEHPFRYPRMAGMKEFIYGCPKCEYTFEEINWVEENKEKPI